MAKLNRERALVERRLKKQAKKDARKQAAAEAATSGASDTVTVDSGDALTENR